MDKLANATANRIRLKIADLKTAELGPEYSYHSLPLCVIDSVFSIGVRYINVQKAVASWCAAQNPPWAKFHTEFEPRKTISDLLAVARKDGEALSYQDWDALPDPYWEAISDRLFGGNRQRTSTNANKGILKAKAVILFARVLKSASVEDFHDIRDPLRQAAARQAVKAVPGHSSGISFDYLMMMAGDDSFVKADRMICRFVERATGKSVVNQEEAKQALTGACQLLSAEYPNLTPRLLDHLIWQYQRTERPEAAGDTIIAA